MEWDNFSEKLQEYFYNEGILDITDNWIDDVCDIYDQIADMNIRKIEELLLIEQGGESNDSEN